MRRPPGSQLALFPDHAAPGPVDRWRVEDQQALFPPPGPARVRLAEVPPEHAALARALPPGLRLGSSSWTFPGWPIWGGRYGVDRLVQEGLAAYGTHPLLRTVGVDRGWYRPVPTRELAAMRDAVPPDFQFLVKAHEDVTTGRFPAHPRYGARAGAENPRFLDVGYALDAVVGPFIEGLGAGVLLFPFAPQPLPRDLPDRLDRFFAALPRGRWRYAVELRNAGALTPAYADVLEAHGVLPSLVGWGGLPSLVEQARRTRALARPERVVRWMLHPGQAYEEAKSDYAPFDTLKAPDPGRRREVVEVLRDADSAWVVINNKAEGCAPASVVELARAVTHRPRIPA